MFQQQSCNTLMLGAADGRGNGVLLSLVRNVAFVGALAVIYMAVSSGLITFNKYLMHDSRFPFAIFIGMLHMTSSFGFNALLFQLCPSLYPSISVPAQKVELNCGLFFKVLLPIAACFSAQLVLSNSAYLHSSVAFLQMMKQSNVVLVYIFSLALSLEQFNCKRGFVLLFIVGATAITIHGELNFSLSGFAFQGASMLCEGMKLTLQSYSLSPTGKRLDALTYVLLVAPLVLLLLSSLLLAMNFLWPGCPKAYSFPEISLIMEYKWLLLGNGVLAFAMNVSHAFFIKNSSAITFILTGVVLKDVLIVVAASIILGELLNPLQVLGFTLQLIGILIWSMLKAEAITMPPAPQVEVAKDPSQWEVLQSDTQDLCAEIDPLPLKRKGVYGLPTVSSQSTMEPTDSTESDDSYEEV